MVRLQVKKRINNNVVYAVENKQKMIVIGKGIGFQVYAGDEINTSLIEKTFLPTEDISLSQIAMMINDSSLEEIQLVEEIIQMVESELNKSLKSNLLFPLLDHIHFALKRHKEKMNIKSPIHWEVKRFYPKEVIVGNKALDIIEKRKGIRLPESESVFIALHLVNGQFDQESIESTIEYTELMNSITQIIKYHYQIEIDEESFVYNRFLTHLRYYLMRRKGGEVIEVSNESLLDMVMTKLPKELECVNKIAEFLYKRFEWETLDEEKMYLMLHVNSLTSKMNRAKNINS